MQINGRKIGDGQPVYIIAEMSANHGGKIENAKKIIRAAKDAGADCIKLQTYTADTITMDCNNEYFTLSDGTWKGENLYHLYQRAYTPWEWHKELKEEAEKLNIDFFSTPFDATAVDFLESIDIDFYKIASFEVVDIPLIRKVAQQGKTVIMSTGMAKLGEIEEAVNVLKSYNCEYALLKCSSAYPAVSDNMNLKTIPNMKEIFGVPVGLSDHSFGSIGAVTAVALGANIIEKHLCLSRNAGGADAAFSMEPDEFKQMVSDVRTAEKAMGHVNYDVTEQERSNYTSRKSIFVTKDIKKGEEFTTENVRVIRPGYGIAPKYMDIVLGKSATKDLKSGTPLEFGMFGGNEK